MVTRAPRWILFRLLGNGKGFDGFLAFCFRMRYGVQQIHTLIFAVIPLEKSWRKGYIALLETFCYLGEKTCSTIISPSFILEKEIKKNTSLHPPLPENNSYI